jgi:hypothetical protein
MKKYYYSLPRETSPVTFGSISVYIAQLLLKFCYFVTDQSVINRRCFCYGLGSIWV